MGLSCTCMLGIFWCGPALKFCSQSECPTLTLGVNIDSATLALFILPLVNAVKSQPPAGIYKSGGY